MQSVSGFAQVDDARLYYERAGSGPAIVLTPAQSLDTRMWDDQFAVFAEHHTVVRYDTRGCGRSSGTSRENNFSYYADLKALMDHLGIEKAALMGVSLGGGISLNFPIVYPESVSALILVGTYFNAYGHWPQMSPLIVKMIETAKESGPEAAKKCWMDRPWFTAAMEQPEVAARLAEMVADYPGEYFAMKEGHDWSKPLADEHLHEITVPTLIVVGDRDTSDNIAVTDYLTAHIPNARKSVMNGVGHIANMEAPVRFNQIVLDFLAEVTF